MDAQQIKKKVILDGPDYYAQHLYIVSSILPVKLTEKEIQVLSLFMDKRSFDTRAKQYVKKRLNLSAANLSNYLRTLLEKGYIKRSEEDIYEVSNLIKLINGRIEYTFILEKSQ
jgi:DNA-binding MarR family transcriptional regulator